MQYIHRTLERKFLKMRSFFKAVLVTGARQVGKTTMLKHLAENENRTYVSMDNQMARSLAKTDPVLFFQMYKPPIIIDEIQKAPELFEQIKIMCDETDQRGLFWLTGSQQYHMISNIRETLAGRIGILELYSLSKNETDNIIFPNELDFTLDCLLERQKVSGKNDITDIFDHIWRGGMPAALDADEEQRQEYFNSYIETYLMRDVSEEGGITDTVRFRRFLNACAALTAEQVNYSTLAEAADISQPTAKAWLLLLESLGIIYLLKPFANNEIKRLAKTPKLYSELLKNYSYSQSKVNLTYYRDSNAKEIDVLIEENGRIHPLEIKKSANPNRREIKKYEVLEKTGMQTGAGGIICMCEEVIPINSRNSFIPCNLI